MQVDIAIVHIRDSNNTIIAQYSNKLVFVDEAFKTSVPSDELTEVYGGGSLAYTISLAAMICLSLIGTSIVLIGFIYFRHEPEIKSTSFSLSLLVFLGCYLTLIYLSLNLHLHQPGPNKVLSILCFSLHLLSGLGVPSALMLATIAVKMLRIYHIFTKHSPKKLSRAWSDAFLLMYVMLILSPMILVYTIWAFVDPYTGFLRYFTHLDVIIIEKSCTSAYLTVWQAILVLYIVILFLILLVLAIRMRKIQNAHFKDTKKVSILVLCLFIDIFLTLVVWRVLHTVVNFRIAAIVLHLGHHTFILLCQGFLFVPKILPPLLQCIKNSRKMVETETTDSHSTNKILIKGSK
jgi:cytochrome bd-type quinol oxidase subunit 2